MIEIPYVNLSAQWDDERDKLLPLIESVLESGNYVGGDEIEHFENMAAQLCETKYVVALNSGTDALICALRALEIGPGDEVITPPNSFVASTAAIVQVGARPVFVDVQTDQNIDPDLIPMAITSHTRAIMPVHLSGRVAEMESIETVAERHGLYVVEDAAQAIGSRYREKPSGSLGTIGCFSTHPLKNLNACGDGGFLTTNDKIIAERVRLMRNHGMVDRETITRFGQVSRMDALQAAVLCFRLERLFDVIEKRRRNANRYLVGLNSEKIFVPIEAENEFHSYHTFVIQVDRRNLLRKFLGSRGISTAIHYPIPIHLQPAAAYLGYGKGDFPITEKQAGRIVTLPINQYMTDQQVDYVVDSVNQFFEKD